MKVTVWINIALYRFYTCDMRAQSLNTHSPEFRISRLFRGLCWAQPWCKTFQMHLGSRFVWPGNLLFFQFFVVFFNFSEMLRCSDLDPSGNAQNRTHLLFILGGAPNYDPLQTPRHRVDCETGPSSFLWAVQVWCCGAPHEKATALLGCSWPGSSSCYGKLFRDQKRMIHGLKGEQQWADRTSCFNHWPNSTRTGLIAFPRWKSWMAKVQIEKNEELISLSLKQDDPNAGSAGV